MSLLEEIENERLGVFGKRNKTEEQSDEESKIIQVSQFMKIARQVLDQKTIDKKTSNKMKDHRFRLKKSQWPLENLIGSLNPSLFGSMCEGIFAGWLKTIRHSQGNGDWQLTEYEILTDRDSDKTELLVLAGRFVDASNKEDLQYANGVPSANVNVNVKSQSIPDEVLTALSNRSTGDDELKDLLKQLISTMAANAAPAAEQQPVVEGEDGASV